MSSSPRRGGPPQPSGTSRTLVMSLLQMGRPETSTSQKSIPTRDIYRAGAHPPKSGNTISQNHDSCAFPRTVEGDARSHVCPQCSS
ncbi:hypothetical protein CISIN_1g041934mg [Citrus sinensis]|uniref:Uncharacterized protein n=1 Tax=Citrus sinensis TaxID=2711 RepID=A0A067ENT7_CITSI|nr:hypothetical protein CISIN_1g041934mg [Citrus sinensis]